MQNIMSGILVRSEILIIIVSMKRKIMYGGGGVLLINCDDPNELGHAKIIREKGTKRIKFHCGEEDNYTWVDGCPSILPSNLLAAFLYPQLEQPNEILTLWMHVWNSCNAALKSFEEDCELRLSVIPQVYRNNAYLFYVIFRNKHTKDNIMDT
jgi:dTDP-4-amino-4,6-dideoxygalactose transaminase